MRRRIAFAALIGLLALAAAAEAAKKEKTEAKELSGMSIVGNNETPKALYLVPWKSSEIGDEADLTAGLLNDAMAPVDKEVFMRQLQYYEISSGKP